MKKKQVRSKQQTNLPNKRMSFAIFIREVATVFRAPLVSTKASCAAWWKQITYSMQYQFVVYDEKICTNCSIKLNIPSTRRRRRRRYHLVQLRTKASNLFSAVTNGKFVSSATAAAIFTSNLDYGRKITTVSFTQCGSPWTTEEEIAHLKYGK